LDPLRISRIHNDASALAPKNKTIWDSEGLADEREPDVCGRKDVFHDAKYAR
jgi:hypothetical protein